MSFDPQVTPIDYIWLDGKRSPGTARIRGASDKRKWDVQAGPFMSGAITIFRGRELAEFSADIYLLSAQDWIDWHKWKALVARTPFGTSPRAMLIAHPWLAELEIRSVQVKERHQPEEDDDTGSYVVTIDFIEFRRPKLALAKPEAAAPVVETDPMSLRIAALSARYQELAGK